jgi:3-oxoacyl-[acyl-carrier-protein] synthase II
MFLSLDRVECRRLDRVEQVAVVAARQAMADAGLTTSENDPDRLHPDRLGVVVGTGIGGAHTITTQMELLHTTGLRHVSPLTVPMLMPNGPAAHVGLALRARAGVHIPVSACASGAEALAWAWWRLLQAGDADGIVAGGAESCINAFTVAGFSQARAMSRNPDPDHASRPWDTGRDGFVLGEGAGMLVLERADHAARRDARVYARLAGMGISADGYHITAPDPDGVGQAKAITTAVRRAQISPADIGHVNCHATSTPLGDRIEVTAMRNAIGEHPVLTAPKSALGHLLGAAGAVEAILTVLAVHHGVVPPTRNLDNPDDAVRDWDIAVDKPRYMSLTAGLSDSFGFGGHNVALLFTAWAS